MNTRSANLRFLRITGLAVGAAAVGGLAVLVTASAAGINLGFRPVGASQPASTASISQATTSAVCTDFITHLTKDLGKSQSQIQSALQQALSQTLADEVKSGKLTQAQADAISKRFANRTLCSLPGPLGRKPLPGAATVPPQAAAYLQELENAAASALGISATQLKTDLASGMSLSQVAAAQKPAVSETTFRSRLIAQLKPLLDAAVTSKKLTQNQENLILQRLQNGPIPFWSRPVPKRPATAVPSPVQGTA